MVPLRTAIATTALSTAVLVTGDRCTPTGPGVCNLGYSGYLTMGITRCGCGRADPSSTDTATSSAAGKTKSSASACSPPSPSARSSGTRSTSRGCRYTTSPKMEFWYAGEGYFGSPACVMGSGPDVNADLIWCQRAFDCFQTWGRLPRAGKNIEKGWDLEKYNNPGHSICKSFVWWSAAVLNPEHSVSSQVARISTRSE